jgi:hypothetical protein
MITITDHMSFVQPMNNWFGVSLYQYTAEGNIFPSDNLKQNDPPLEQIILISSQPVFALTP